MLENGVPAPLIRCSCYHPCGAKLLTCRQSAIQFSPHNQQKRSVSRITFRKKQHRPSIWKYIPEKYSHEIFSKQSTALRPHARRGGRMRWLKETTLVRLHLPWHFVWTHYTELRIRKWYVGKRFLLFLARNRQGTLTGCYWWEYKSWRQPRSCQKFGGGIAVILQ